MLTEFHLFGNLGKMCKSTERENGHISIGKFTSWSCACWGGVFKPPPPVGAGGGYMFSGRPSVPLSVRACVRPSVIHVVVLFPRYLQYLLTDFRQTSVIGASRDRDELIRFWGQRSQFKVTA